MRRGTPLFWLWVTMAIPACAQTSLLNCTAASSTPLVRAEGVTERIGDIVLSCTGEAGATIAGNLTLFLPTNVTNHLAADNSTDAQLTVDTGAGATSSGAASRLITPAALTFEGFQFAMPASGAVTLRVTNVRILIAQTPPADDAPLEALFAINGVMVGSSQLPVAFLHSGLLASSSSQTVSCGGSTLPGINTLSALFSAGAVRSSVRVTEGFAEAFQKNGAYMDTGTRVMLRYSGFPTGSQLLVPDVVAGSSAVEATSGGDLGLPEAGGKYAPTEAGSLLLVRVLGADSSGAGGTLVYVPGSVGSGEVSFNTVSAVSLTDGAGMAVYEVADADASLRESAQIPTFFGIPATHDGTTSVASVAVSWAPLSETSEASTSAPVPRFTSTSPASDCDTLGDCDASYFPHLLVDAPSFAYSGTAGGATQIQYLGVQNQGGGVLSWTVSTSYKSGSGWLRVSPESGYGTSTVQVAAVPESLAQGTYEATLTVDAGPLAGSRSFAVSFVVGAPDPSANAPVVQAVANAATFASGSLVAGSLATVMGLRLAGQAVSVAFDGLPATILYNSSTQINLQVPAGVSGRNTAQMVVTVDGLSGQAYAVALADAAPGIFSNGILNQDNSVNGADHPAAPGSTIQVFATGLISTQVASVIARIEDRNIAFPAYFGPSPGSTGVQQVNLAIPAGLASMTTQVYVCALTTALPGSPVCSPAAPLVIGAASVN